MASRVHGEGVVQLGEVAHRPAVADGFLRLLLAVLLVALERRFDGTLPGDKAAQRVGVVDRPARPHGGERRGRVSGVTEEDDPTLYPRGERIEVPSLGADDLGLVGRLNGVVDERIPALDVIEDRVAADALLSHRSALGDVPARVALPAVATPALEPRPQISTWCPCSRSSCSNSISPLQPANPE